MSPAFKPFPVPSLEPGLTELLPEQGSFELQHDQPGKTHDWHRHDLDEELLIISGEALLFWVEDDGAYRKRRCPPGTWITLPAGTCHGSVAGSGGAVYLIRPKDGRTAETTFLAPADHPHPTPRFSQAGA